MNITKIFCQEFQKESPHWRFKSRGREKKKSVMVVLQVSQATVMSSKKDWSHQNIKEILFNCLRNLQEKATEISNLAQDTRNMQIKGDKQLEQLKSSVEVVSDIHGEYEKDQKEKEKK